MKRIPMKNTTWLLALILATSTSHADISALYWDGTSTSANSQVDGGDGTWDSSSTNWTDDIGNINSMWSDGQRAVFSGTAGTVTIANGFTPAPTEIEFADLITGAYTLTATGTGGISNTSNLLIILGDNTAATIAAPITGAGTLQLNVGATGTNVLYLTGANNYTGATTLNGSAILSIGDGATTGSITSDVDLLGAGSELWFDRSNDYTYNGVISSLVGSSVTIMGGGNITFTAAQDYNGDTDIDDGGRLILASSASLQAGQTTTVSDTGLLGGTGMANMVTVESGGTIAPGLPGSIGTLNAEALTLNAGSTTEIHMSGLTAGTQHDQINVTNTATLAGTLSVLLANGYTPNTGDTYDVMLANLFTGTYDSIISNNPLVSLLATITADCELVGCPDILRLTATNTALGPRALSYNALQMATAIDGERTGGFGGNFEPYLTDWIAMNDSDLNEAMLQISPHRMSSMIRSSLQLMEAAQTRFNNHMAMLRHSGVQTVARQPVGVNSEVSILKVDPTRYGAWFEGTGNFADIDSLNHTLESGGAHAGIDYQFNPELTAGFFAGYHQSETDLHALGSDIEIDGTNIGLYGLYQPHDSAFYYQAMASFGLNDYQTRRNFIVGPDLFNARGDTDGIQYDINGTAGWEHELGDYQLNLEAGLRYAAVKVDGYTENGANPFNVIYQDEDGDSLQSVLTARLNREHKIGSRNAISEARIGWRYEYLDPTLTTTGSFAGGAGTPFAVISPGLDRSTAELGIGTTLLIDSSRSLSLNYDAQISGDFTSHNINAMFRYNW